MFWGLARICFVRDRLSCLLFGGRFIFFLRSFSALLLPGPRDADPVFVPCSSFEAALGTVRLAGSGGGGATEKEMLLQWFLPPAVDAALDLVRVYSAERLGGGDGGGNDDDDDDDDDQNGERQARRMCAVGETQVFVRRGCGGAAGGSMRRLGAVLYFELTAVGGFEVCDGVVTARPRDSDRGGGNNTTTLEGGDWDLVALWCTTDANERVVLRDGSLGIDVAREIER